MILKLNDISRSFLGVTNRVTKPPEIINFVLYCPISSHFVPIFFGLSPSLSVLLEVQEVQYCPKMVRNARKEGIFCPRGIHIVSYEN